MAKNFYGITDKGKRRQKNEDTFLVQELYNKEWLVACVIDGVGGYSGGDVAAAIARTVILEQLQNLSKDIPKTLKEAIVAANARIRDEKKKDPKNEQMACVLTCAITHIKNNKLYYAHVGDTRLYLLRDHSLVKLSKDHSVVGFLEDSGRLSEEDAMLHPRRNEINKALGFEENISEIKDFIETGESPFLPGDTILLCSDGLTDMINSTVIKSVLKKNSSIAEKAQELVDNANEAGGDDNITVVLVENYKQPKPQVVLKPAGRKNDATTSKQDTGNNSPGQHPVTPKKKHHNLVGFSTLLLLSFLAVLLFQQSTRIKKRVPASKNKNEKQKNEKLNQLISHVNDSTKTYILDQGEPVLELAGPVLINKDSFYLAGNGITITADSNYKGPAIIINKTAKHIVLDSIVFKNFDAAIVVQKNNVVLKNVRFINCRIPLEYLISFPDTVITGRIKDSIFMSGKPINNFK